MFKIKAGVFGQLLNMVSEINNEVKINLTETGLSIKTKDNDNVMIGTFSIKRSAFEAYTSGESIEIYAYKVLSILNRVDPDELCLFKRVDDTTSLEIGNKWFNISTEDDAQQEPRIPNLGLPVSFRINPKVLYDDLRQCIALSNHISIIYQENNVSILSFDDDYDELLFKATYTQDKWIENMYSSRFSLDLLNSLLSSLCYNKEFICDEIKISFGNDYPLTIEGQVNEEFSFMFMLAPRIERVE